jgi:uncharacterized glyoxalase superfamily protein PhnB
VVKDIVPTFFVADVLKAAQWYERVLGFKTAFIAQDPGAPAIYGGVELGPARIHLARFDRSGPPLKWGVIGIGAAYLRLESGVDELVAAAQAAGGEIISPLSDHDYGMREATIRDLDGNHLYLGQFLQPSRRTP